MKHRTAICFGLAAMSLAAFLPVPAAAQELPPYEAVTIIRSMGLDPLGPAVRRGSAYILRALDGYGREVSVTLDARQGRILSVRPVVPVAAPYGPPPPAAYPSYGRPRYAPPPPYPDEEIEIDSEYEPIPPGGPRVIYAPRAFSNFPRPPVQVPGAKVPAAQAKPTSQTASTPLPKPAPRAMAAAPAEPGSSELTTGSVSDPAKPAETSPAPAIPPVQSME